MHEKVTLSEVISSAVRSGLTQDEADKAVERMIRDGIIFMREEPSTRESGPSF